jgi:hypothetical protein
MRSDSILYSNTAEKFAAGDVLIISDCQTAEILQAKEVFNLQTEQKIIAEQPLKKRYEKNAEISKLAINTYFIGDTGRLSESGKPILALYSRDLLQHKQELVEGVSQLLPSLDIDQAENKGVSLILKFETEHLQREGYLYVSLI